MALPPPPAAHLSVARDDPLTSPDPSHGRNRAYSNSSTGYSHELFAPGSSRAGSMSSPQRFALEGMRPRGASIIQGQPMTIDDFAIPDPFDGDTPEGGSQSRTPDLPASAGALSFFGRDAQKSAVWPQRSREASPAGSRAGSRPGSRAGSRAPSRSASRIGSRAGSLVREPMMERTGPWAPALISPSMFLDLPTSDPLQTLLNKFVPPQERPVRNVDGRWEGRTIADMVATSSWRALANYARDHLIRAVPSDIKGILELWHLRLHSLLNLLLPHQHHQELTALFHGIRISNVAPAILDNAMPFELEVFLARSKSYVPVAGSGQGEKDIVGAIEDLTILLRQCRYRARQAAKAQKSADVEGGGTAAATLPGGLSSVGWKDRAMRVGITIAGLMVELKDYPAAIALLEPIFADAAGKPSSSLYLGMISLQLSAGILSGARQMLDRLLSDDVARDDIKAIAKAMVASCYGNWPLMQETLKGVEMESPAADSVAANNLAVAFLNAGQLDQASSLLQSRLDEARPGSFVEPMLFNTTTLFELDSGSSSLRKVNLLLQTAGIVGDGLKPGCLKLS